MFLITYLFDLKALQKIKLLRKHFYKIHSLCTRVWTLYWLEIMRFDYVYKKKIYCLQMRKKRNRLYSLKARKTKIQLKFSIKMSLAFSYIETFLLPNRIRAPNKIYFRCKQLCWVLYFAPLVVAIITSIPNVEHILLKICWLAAWKKCETSALWTYFSSEKKTFRWILHLVQTLNSFDCCVKLFKHTAMNVLPMDRILRHFWTVFVCV